MFNSIWLFIGMVAASSSDDTLRVCSVERGDYYIQVAEDPMGMSQNEYRDAYFSLSYRFVLSPKVCLRSEKALWYVHYFHQSWDFLLYSKHEFNGWLPLSDWYSFRFATIDPAPIRDSEPNTHLLKIQTEDPTRYQLYCHPAENEGKAVEDQVFYIRASAQKDQYLGFGPNGVIQTVSEPTFKFRFIRVAD